MRGVLEGLVVAVGEAAELLLGDDRRDRDPFIDQAGREALNFSITIAIYGSLLLVAALMLVGIPLLGRRGGGLGGAGLGGGRQGQ
jgi:uncharacterized Tic20 family protein